VNVAVGRGGIWDFADARLLQGRLSLFFGNSGCDVIPSSQDLAFSEYTCLFLF